METSAAMISIDQALLPCAASLDASRDGDLLRLYAEADDEAAFEKVVSRHLDWVYSVALRQLRDPIGAQDATQAVFIALARKAGTFRGEAPISGWLFRAVRFAAIDMIRADSRRQKREQSAVTPEAAGDQSESSWEEIAPVLDHCLAELRASDQRAILLRYYERKGWSEIGEALGLKENTARVRVDRALVRLRALLKRRGVVGSVAGLSVVLLANTVQAAPYSAGAVVAAKTSATVAGLVGAVLRSFAVRQVIIAAVAIVLFVSVALTFESFRRIPPSQSLPLQQLIGPGAFAALVDLDRASVIGDADVFVSKMHFGSNGDQQSKAATHAYLQAAATFRRAGASKFNDRMFGYYEMLDDLLAGRDRPTIFNKEGDHAAGCFARNRGIYLIRVKGEWKWDFARGVSATDRNRQIQGLERKTALLTQLTDAIRGDPEITPSQARDAYRLR